MAIPTGQRLGPYEILSAIGAGGMGEVYRARDSKLGRDVALKVLPAAFISDSERMSRFEREARLLAALNHPNIAAIYGLEESSGTPALVMELVEGPTLADRIATGPLPLDEALPIAKQIAEALEYAHERGVIHRDLKPANIKVKADGTVKVLDFGLAKTLTEDQAAIDMSNSPTLSMGATVAGVILGTAAYMSPEQAKGKTVDRRADVWAFGCVLYEMLTSKQAFQGEDVTEVLAAVINKDPLLDALPPKTQPAVRNLIRRCLDRNLRQRLSHIGEARITLEGALSGTILTEAPAQQNGRALSRQTLLPVLGALCIGTLIAGFAVWRLKPESPRPITRTVINLPPGDRLAALDFPAIALSPDGTQLAYVAIHGGTRQIYLRTLDSLEAKPLAGTEGANTPFFSPDGQWLGFFTAGRLKKISVHGGAPLTLATATANNRGASWTDRGTILLAPNNATSLQRVPEGGGTLQPLTQLGRGDTAHRWPESLPGGKAVLYAVNGGGQQIAVQALNSSATAVAGERQNLAQGGTTPRYAASGHLLYVVGGDLMAVPFDPQRLRLTGSAAPVVEGILQLGSINGGAQYSVSTNGSLAYISGGAQAEAEQMVWVSRNGVEKTVNAPAHAYGYPRVAQRIAVSVAEQETQLWLYDLVRDTLSRLTFGSTSNTMPTWTWDGKRIAFASNKEGPTNIFWQLTDGSGGLERLTTSEYPDYPSSFSSDGKLLTYTEVNPTTGNDIWVLNIGDHKTEPFLRTPFNELASTFSPDGRWMAYVSDESGHFEVYVQPFPGPGGKYQVSTDGGNEPVWNRNGKELFYRSGDKMMAVDVTLQPGFSMGKPKELFRGTYMPPVIALPFYDVSPDGQRFLMLKPNEQTSSSSLTQIVVVQNWFEELKQKVPTGKK